jgi:predicted ATP-grasp superfamily ATP-dependent carboligase
MNRVVQEIGNLKDLSIGTMELIKEFPDYEESLEKLKISLKEKQEEKQKN